MEKPSLHRMEIAKERMRKKLSFEYVTSIPRFKDLNQEEYEELINNIESLSLIFLDSYFSGNHHQEE